MSKSKFLTSMCQIFEILSNPLRMQIFLSVLSSGCDCDIKSQQGKTGNCVSGIMKELDLPQSTVSTYLKDLEKVGLIQSNKKGKYLYCAPSEKALIQIQNFVEGARKKIRISSIDKNI